MPWQQVITSEGSTRKGGYVEGWRNVRQVSESSIVQYVVTPYFLICRNKTSYSLFYSALVITAHRSIRKNVNVR